jgi:FHS family Na+ dependent glucose MFS transporter 1
VAYFASAIILGFATAAEGPSLPTLASHTSSPLDRISLLFVIGAFGYLVGSLLGGRAYDLLPGHRVMAIMLAMILAAAVIYPLAPALWVLLLAALVMGLGKGALDVGCNTLLQWVHGSRVGPFMNGLHFAFGVGSFLAPILLAQILARTHDVYWAFWILAMLCVPLAVWLWFLPEPASSGHAVNRDNAPVPFLPVLLMVLAFFLYVGAEIGFGNWVYTYAITLRLADAITAAYLTSAYWGLFTVGRLLGVWISTRARSNVILIFDLGGSLLCMALIYLGSASAALLWLGTICLGLSMASVFPTMLMLASQKLRVSGTITGWFLVGSGAGGMLLPWLIGHAFTSWGPLAMMSMIFIDLLLNLAVLLFFMYSDRLSPRPAASLSPDR